MKGFMSIAVMFKQAAFKANHLLLFQMSAIPPVWNKGAKKVVLFSLVSPFVKILLIDCNCNWQLFEQNLAEIFKNGV